MNIKHLIVGIACLSIISVAHAEISTSAYRKYKDISPGVSVPTVVEVPFSSDFIEQFDFNVVDTTNNSSQPYLFVQKTTKNSAVLSVAGDSRNMVDGNVSTYSEFSITNDSEGQVSLTVTSPKTITTSALTILLDNFVALPQSIEIRIPGKVVVAKRSMNQQTVYFPKTTSATWLITLTYGQPLRISELRFAEESVSQANTQAIRFLAEPGHQYRVYFDPDRHVVVSVGESGNLSTDQDVKILPSVTSQNNPSYVIADTDQDNIPDIRDNCVSVANPDQADVNNNGRGDACDDFDKDGIINSLDNCPALPNRDQLDTDGDHIGDVCDKEESRVTEKYPWIPWVGIGTAAVVLIGLFAITATSLRKKE